MPVFCGLCIFLVLVSVIPTVSCQFLNTSSCTIGWVPYGQSCYFFGKQPLSWFDAAQRCRDLGGYLVTVNDASENDFLVNYMQTSPLIRYFGITVPRINYQSALTGKPHSVAWMGFNDLYEEGSYQWVDSDSDSTYTNWFPTEPNNAGGNEHCGFFMAKAPGYDYTKWYDCPCDWLAPFVCEASQ